MADIIGKIDDAAYFRCRIKSGATTLWESWKGRRSRNHVIFGDFADWAYPYVAGMKPIEPGFRKFEVRSCPPSALLWIKAQISMMCGSLN